MTEPPPPRVRWQQLNILIGPRQQSLSPHQNGVGVRSSTVAFRKLGSAECAVRAEVRRARRSVRFQTGPLVKRPREHAEQFSERL
jgi:hypothetical protein